MAQVVETPEQASVADGATASFTIPFTFTARAEIEVVVIDGETAARTLQVLDEDYAIPDGDWETSGGSIVFLPGHLPAEDATVERRRITPPAQTENFGDDAAFRPVANEGAFDKLTRAAAEAKAVTDRAATSPIGEPGLKIPSAATRRGKVLGFADTEDAQPLAVANEAVAVAEDVALSTAARQGAEVARDAATAQAAIALAQAALAALAAGEATAAEAATALQIAEAGLLIDDAQAIVDALDTSTLYPDIATGRAAVANGVAFKVGTIGGPGVEYYRRIDASTQSTLFTLPSATELGKRVDVVQLIPAASPGTGRNPVMKLAKSWVVLPADRTGVKFFGKHVGDRDFGSASLTIRNYADTVDLLAATPWRNADGVNVLDAGQWLQNDSFEVERDPVTFNIHEVRYPNPAFTVGQEVQFRDGYELPSPQKPVMVERVADGFLVKSASIAYDDPARRSNADFVVDKIILAGPIGMSGGALQNPYAPTWHWSMAEKRGRRYHYGNIGSRHEGAGTFARIQPSTDTYALRVGPMSETNLNAVSGGHPVHDFLGDWHGNKAEIECSVVVGATDMLAAAVGRTASGTSLAITRRSRIFMPYVAVEADMPNKWIGEVAETLTLDATGRHFAATFDVGQRIEISAGTAAVARGATMTGSASGATAYVCLVPDYDMTGTGAGGDLAGVILIDVIAGTWDAGGEDFTIGGVLAGHTEGSPSGEVSEVNGYVPMLITRGCNRAKAEGFAAVVVGTEDGATITLATGADGVGKGVMAAWFDDAGDVDGGMIYEVLLPDGPSVPPGDFSECTTSVMTAQKRAEGVDKLYSNRRSNTVPVKWARRTTIGGTYRWRDGAPA